MYGKANTDQVQLENLRTCLFYITSFKLTGRVWIADPLLTKQDACSKYIEHKVRVPVALIIEAALEYKFC